MLSERTIIMATKEMHVFGGFKTWQGANVAAQRLVTEAGVPHSNVGILMADEARNTFGLLEKHTRAAEGATLGGLTGGVLTGVAVGLTAIASVAIPGIGLLAAGPLVAALAGFGAGAAAGGAVGGLIGLGMTEYEVKTYEDLLKAHGVVVSVTTFDTRTRNRCAEILESSGALKVHVDKGPLVNMQATA
jgi:hypothetical protein